MIRLITILLLMAFSLGCMDGAGAADARNTSSEITPGTDAIDDIAARVPHPTVLHAELESYTGPNNADAILLHLDVDLASLEKLEPNQPMVEEYRLNDIFFLRHSLNGSHFQNGRPVWIYCTEK